MRRILPLAALLAASGCGQGAAPFSVEPEDPATTTAVAAACSAPRGSDAAAQALAHDDTTFAVAFYPPAAAAAGAGQNVVLSPYSASIALAMLDAGAAGQTAAQIESTLALPGSGAAVAPTFAALVCDDETDGSSNGNQLSVASSLWGQQGMAFQKSFLSTLADGYAAPLRTIDFGASSATGTINAWVSEETQGQIPQLFTPGEIGAATRLVLVNAVYFKGVWATGFDPSATKQLPFTRGDGTVVEVPTMNGTLPLSLGTGDGFSVVELPYEGGAIAIDFLVPDDDLAALEGSLTPGTLLSALGSLHEENDVSLFLPRFSLRTRLTLQGVLAGMGMKDVFTQDLADLSGIDGKHDLYVSLVVQQAMIDVDEQGTVAAAATGVVVSTNGAAGPHQPAVVHIDRPFLFLLRDTRTGSVLFMGQVEDPSAVG